MPVVAPKNTDFELLGLSPDAGEDEIRVAYKKLALKWHPDRHIDDKEEAQEKFIEINAAYRALLEQCRHKRRVKPTPARPERNCPWAPSSPSASSSTSSASASSTSTPSTSTSNASSRDRTSTSSASEPHKKVAREENEKSREKHPAPAQKEHSEETRSARTSTESQRPERDYHAHDHHEHDHASHINGHHERRYDAHDHRLPHDRHEHDYSRHAPKHSRQHSTDSWSDAEDAHIHKKRSHSFLRTARLDEDEYEFVSVSSPLPPLRRPSESALSKDWIFPLAIPLEDLYFGATHHYRITRTLWSGRTQRVPLELAVAPGWRAGTRVRVPGAGNERRDGTFQDIVFVVGEAPHARFARAGDDLVAPVQVPWRDPHAAPGAEEEEEVYVLGLGGEGFALPIPRTLVEGADGTRVVGAGMPVRRNGNVVGKGDLVIKWEFVFPESEAASRWHGLKRSMPWRHKF